MGGSMLAGVATVGRLAKSLRLAQTGRRLASLRVVKVPFLADSLTQGTLGSWDKQVGEFAAQDEPVAQIETDKVSIPVNAPVAGRVAKHYVQPGDTVDVGADLFALDTDVKGADAQPERRERAVISGSSEPTGSRPSGDANAADQQSSAAKAQADTGRRNGTEESEEAATQSSAAKAQPATKGRDKTLQPDKTISSSQPISKEESVYSGPQQTAGASGESNTSPDTTTSQSVNSLNIYVEKMSRMRMRIAERMKEAQSTAASLTTFNEVDMSALVRLRKEHGQAFAERHGGARLGFVSPVIRACAHLLGREMPLLNARISPDGASIIHSRTVDVSVAVATPRGLVTPVLRDAGALSLAEIEAWLASTAARARENKLALSDLAGGTFTVSNGGVFGSLLGTPILNPPQSAVLGMHAIKDRPVAVDGCVVVRPMMYVALTYDHRLVDGREAATFLVRLKAMLEDPALLALDG